MFPFLFHSEYLHESIVPTDHFQKSLPRLPIPELEKTCERYLATQRAYLNDDAFNKTKSYTDTFKSEVGEGGLKFNQDVCCLRVILFMQISGVIAQPFAGEVVDASHNNHS